MLAACSQKLAWNSIFVQNFAHSISNNFIQLIKAYYNIIKIHELVSLDIETFLSYDSSRLSSDDVDEAGSDLNLLAAGCCDVHGVTF